MANFVSSNFESYRDSQLWIPTAAADSFAHQEIDLLFSDMTKTFSYNLLNRIKGCTSDIFIVHSQTTRRVLGDDHIIVYIDLINSEKVFQCPNGERKRLPPYVFLIQQLALAFQQITGEDVTADINRVISEAQN